MSAKPLIIAIDGPAGAGKSTTARRVAEVLGYIYIDTGAMYRAVSLSALRSSCALTNEALGLLAEASDIRLEPSDGAQKVLLNGEDVSLAIRQADVTAIVSQVSAFSSVRKALVKRQRQIGEGGGVVMDGRDIGSVVFPHAEVKVFLVADTDERVRRRLLEAQTRGEQITEDDVRQQIISRDEYDSNRAESPLIKASGAVEIDTTTCTIDEQVQTILDLVRSYQTTHSIVSAHLGF
ncbi:MAG: (d)CMP kinase [Candidatus Kapabacteria bacterium]|nr:(d)CMP kinase [Candidatus Kapabacteria bacterium]